MIGMFMQWIVVNGSIWLIISSLFSEFLIVNNSAKIFPRYIILFYIYLKKANQRTELPQNFTKNTN